MRQLNFYNFRKVNRERTFWVYKHPMFHRDRPGDLGRLRRKTCPGVDGRKKQEARVEDGQSLAASSSPANQNQSNASSYNKHYQYSKQYTKQYSKQVQYKNQQQSKQNSGNSASGTRTSARLGRPPRRGSGSGSSGNSATIGGGFHSPMMQQQQLQHDPYHSGNGDVDGGGGGSAIPGYGHLPCSGGSSPVFECGVSHPHPHPHPHVHVHGGSYLEEGVDANDSSSDCDETSYAKKRPRAAQSGGGGCFGDGGKGKRSRNERSERSQMVAAVSQQLEAYARRAREQTKHGYDDEDSSDDDDGNGEEDEGGGGGCGSDDYRDGNGAMPAAGTIKLNQIKNGAACEVPTRFGNGIEGGTLGCVSAPPSRKQADQSTCSVNGKGSDAVEIVRTVSTERSGMSAGGALAPGHGAVTNRIGRPRKNKRGGRRKETSELSDTMRWSALTYDDEVVDVDDGQGYGREKATSNRPSNATPMRKGGCVTPQSSASRSSSPPISVMSSTPSSYKRLDVAPRSYFEETRNAGHSSSSSSDFVADSGSGVTFPKLSSTAPCSSTVNFIGIKCSLPALTQFCLTTPPNTVIEKSTTLRDLLGRDEDVRKDFEMYRLALSPRSCLSKHQDDDDDDDDDEGDDEDREHRGAQGDDEKKDDDDEDGGGGGGDEGGRCGMPGEEGDRGTGPLDSFKAEKENASSAFGVPPPPPHAVAALSLAPLLRSFFPYCANHVAEIISDNIEELGNKNVWIKAKEQWLEAARATQ